jgi:poly-gamma-glutamate synthesis protein (capsule biosynthesis protein)
MIPRLFSEIRSLFSKRDLIVANLECAITDSEEKIKKFGPALKAPKETASVLSKVGVDLVGLSNNHVFDYGVRGALDTTSALDSVGIAYTGFGKNYEDSRKNYVFLKNGEKIAVVAVCEHELSYALDNRMGSRPYDEYDTMEDIELAKANSDRVIVLYHGGKEFSEYPSPRLRKLCRAMVKHGADVVLCQHSHCIGCYEKYMDSHIVYGQGNFHFLDPDPHESWYSELAVEYDTVSGEIGFIPLRTTDDYISLAKDADAEKIMSGFKKRSDELQNGEWLRGWQEFCEGMRERYVTAVTNAYNADSTEIDNNYFAHILDCEAHTDVWRELFPTWNKTNCLD